MNDHPVTDVTHSDGPGARTLKKVERHLMPMLCAMYLIAYIDRQNVSYAKLEMVDALGLSEAAYGLGASLFFLGYFLFEAPSNIILAKVGARRWFARIMGSWGLVTLALGFTQNTTMFYVLRFLLGVAEAGFFPGVLYLLTLWFPQQRRAAMVGLFMIARAFANAIGALVGGALLELSGIAGLAGWQWVFVATAIPAIALVPVVLRTLPDSPDHARFLTVEEKSWLAAELAAEPKAAAEGSAWQALVDRRVLLFAALFIGMPFSAYGLSYWLPTIVKGFGATDLQNGAINVIPWLCVAIALWAVPRHAARHGASVWHVAGPLFVASLSLLGSFLLPGAILKFASLCIAAAAIFSAQPSFWSIPQRLLTGGRAAAGLAVINSVGNLGGFLAQNAVPALRDASGSNLVPMAGLSLVLAITATACLVVLGRMAREVPDRVAPR